MSRTVLDLFSAAAGGWSLGMHRAGFRSVAACEREDWRRALYAENNPGVILYDDVCTLTADRLRNDLGFLPKYVVGSPPCQDISSANTKGRGVEGERSGLYFEAVRIIGEVRPRWFALENSSNLRTRGADAVIVALEGIGYTCWAFVVRAGDIGANHERGRSWLIGCDLEQVTDVQSVGCTPWARSALGARRADERDEPSDPARDTAQDGCGSRIQGRRAEPDQGLSEPTCGDAGHSNSEPCASRIGASAHEGCRNVAGGRVRSDAEHGGSGSFPTANAHGHSIRLAIISGGSEQEATIAGYADQGRNTPDPDQAGQADGCMVPGLRQAEITDDGCRVGRSDDRSSAGQVGLCSPDRGDADDRRADWSLDDLADHLQLDDGLSTWVAGTRIAVGGPKGTSAASLLVEAFGDAVVPQIPEAIGRAIIRTEQALAAIYARSAA